MKPPDDREKILELFIQGPALLESAISGLGDDELDYTPSNGGWTIREIVHHIADGDDLWKTGIKIALGNEEAEFTLKWYSALPQIEWAKRWGYEKRPIDESLTLLKASRNHILQLIEYLPDGWNSSVKFREPNGEIEEVPVGFVIQMQADHVVHHVNRIRAIRKEISGS